MAKKMVEPETLPPFEVAAVQHVELRFPRYKNDYGLGSYRSDFVKNLSQAEAAELSRVLNDAALKINE